MMLASLSACADYMNRRDSVSFGAGNAAEGNTAIHTINPFPPAASNTTIVVGG
ncbi:MAG: hypothetical protein LPJ92_00955 [Rhodobacterales bacterium]|nr:hypothetical protein [Rhodobacterales bacterium]